MLTKKRLVYDSGYKWLLGEYGKKNTAFLLGELFLLSVLAFSGVHVMETVTGINPILLATYRGRKWLTDIKKKVSLLIYSGIFLVVFGLRLIAIGMVYGYPMLGASANSLMWLWFLPKGISILLWIVLVHGFYFAIGYALLRIILKISSKATSQMSAMFLSMVAAILIWSLCCFGLRLL